MEKTKKRQEQIKKMRKRIKARFRIMKEKGLANLAQKLAKS